MNVDRRIEALERRNNSHIEDYSKYIGRRIRMGYLNEEEALTAQRFRRAKKIEDRKLPPEAEELWGEDYSSAQVHEEAIRRLAAKLESKYLRPGCNTHHDLRPHVPEWWFDKDHTEELICLLTEVIDDFVDQVQTTLEEDDSE